MLIAALVCSKLKRRAPLLFNFFRLKPSKNLVVLTSDFIEADEARVLTWGYISCLFF